jgi:PAS domain S-box-containing protein
VDPRYGLTPEQALERMHALQGLALDLAVARTGQEVCAVLARHAQRATGAGGAAVWYLDATRRTGVGAVTGELAGRPLPVPDMAAHAAATDPRDVRPWLEPELATALRAGGASHTRNATLHGGGAVVGALALVYPEAPQATDSGLLGAIVRPAGEALARALTMTEALRLADIVESSDHAILSTDVDGHILSWNPAAERVFGAAAADAVGRHLSFLRPGEERDPHAVAALERIHAGGGPQHYEVEHVRPDGRPAVLAVMVAPMHDPTGALTGLSFIVDDLTGRRTAERRAQQLAAVVEAAPEATLVLDLEGRVVECNPAVAAVFGVSREQVLGRDGFELVPAAERAAAQHVFERARAGERVEVEPLWRTRADGHRVRLSSMVFPVRDDSGAVTAVVSTVHDVTERARLTEALNQAQRLEALGRLAGGVAHDFNNMLTVIDGYGHLVREGLPPGGERDGLDEILAAAGRARDLTRNLLAFSRTQATEPARLDVRELAGDLLPMLQRLIGDDVRLRLVAPDRVAAVRADRSLLEQVVVNLLLNARDAMPRGGDVAIEVGQVRLAEGDAPAELAPGDYVRIAVADTGVGMAPETLDRVFDPFFTTKRGADAPARGEGTGLGLATAYGTVAQAGGHIGATSAPGAGTRVTIHLPVADGVRGAGAAALAPGDGAPPSVAAGPSGDGDGDGGAAAARILVCEDEPQLLRLIERILSRAGYAVLAADHPLTALELAAGAPAVDLLVSDVLMPELSGPELAERLTAERPGLRVVFVSGYTAESFVGAAWRERGVLLDKPFDADTLVRAVREQLAERTDAAPRPPTP